MLVPCDEDEVITTRRVADGDGSGTETIIARLDRNHRVHFELLGSIGILLRVVDLHHLRRFIIDPAVVVLLVLSTANYIYSVVVEDGRMIASWGWQVLDSLPGFIGNVVTITFADGLLFEWLTISPFQSDSTEDVNAVVKQNSSTIRDVGGQIRKG